MNVVQILDPNGVPILERTMATVPSIGDLIVAHIGKDVRITARRYTMKDNRWSCQSEWA